MRRSLVIGSCLCLTLVILIGTLPALFLVPRSVHIVDARPVFNVSSGAGGNLQGNLVARLQIRNENFVPVTITAHIFFKVSGCVLTVGNGTISQTRLSPRSLTETQALGTILYNPIDDPGFCVLHAFNEACPSIGLSLKGVGVAEYSTWIKSGSQALTHDINIDCATLSRI